MNLITIFYTSETLHYWICSGCISRTIIIKMTACVMCAKPGTYLLPHYMNNSMTIVSVDFLVVQILFFCSIYFYPVFYLSVSFLANKGVHNCSLCTRSYLSCCNKLHTCQTRD